MTNTAALVALTSILVVAVLAWMQSVRRRDASIADICWGLGFVLLAWMYVALSRAVTPRAWLAAVLGDVVGNAALVPHPPPEPRPRRGSLIASAARPASLTVLDGLGILLFAVGFSFEAVGDAQLQRFPVTARISHARRPSSHGFRADRENSYYLERHRI